MGLLHQAAGAALEAAFPGASEAESKKRNASKRSGDSPGDRGYGPPDGASSSSDAGSDDDSYGKRFAKAFGRNLTGRSGSGRGFGSL